MPEGNSSPLRLSLGKTDHHEEEDYVVNNSLPGSLHPKRTAENIKLYMQLHKKIMRSVIIEKKFAQAKKSKEMTDSHKTAAKGFRGSTLSGFAARKSPTSKVSRIRTEVELQSRESKLNSQSFYYGHRESSMIQRQFFTRHAPKSQFKPNLMYNLTLYRKSFRRGKSYTEDYSSHSVKEVAQGELPVSRHYPRGSKIRTQV